MAQKDEQGLVKATAEDLTVITPDDVPEMVECFISKREIKGEDARLVQYDSKKTHWVHKRFLGEVDVLEDDDDLTDDFDLAGIEREVVEAAEAAEELAEDDEDLDE